MNQPHQVNCCFNCIHSDIDWNDNYKCSMQKQTVSPDLICSEYEREE